MFGISRTISVSSVGLLLSAINPKISNRDALTSDKQLTSNSVYITAVSLLNSHK